MLGSATPRHLVNTVRWGHGGETGRHEVEVRVSLQDGALVLSVVDDTPPFNPLEAPAPDLTSPSRAGPSAVSASWSCAS